MSSFKEIRRKSWLKIILFYALNFLHSPSSSGVSAIPNGPRLVGIIPPPQVLLPPHREEGQSLDDIIYGTSFSGGSLFPSSLTSRPPSITTTLRPSQSHANFQSLRNRVGAGSNPNLVQTFLPPSPPPLPSTTTTTTTTMTTSTSRPFSAPSNSIFAGSSFRPSSPFSSGEEIKVPQALKLRSPHRKQYSKADLIAAANSLKPAGFDFNKLAFVGSPSSSSPAPRFRNSNSSDDKASHLYQNARFPLPLFDTPVFNELRPLMEMIMKQRQLQQQQKQQQQQQQQQAKFSTRNSDSANDNNKKVLVIIPKQSSSGNSGSSSRSVTNRGGTSASSGNRQAKQLPSFSTPSRSPPSTSSQDRSSTSSNFIVIPKTSKLTTTTKPKSFQSTTKRTSSKLTEVSKKSEKNPDLQVAATSNKLTQQKTNGKNPSSSSGDTDKRSYSIKGADKYSFSYEVKNDAFGDVKSHSESRDGDLVTGEYSMLESDGYTRIVKYSVDADQGFKASVKRIPPSKLI